jgi:hypothetical protein
MAAGSMAKASTHEKVGHTDQGLWKHKGWQLPAYIQHVANDLKAKVGESRAVQMAVGIVKNWAAGHDGKGHKVSATTQAAAQKAVAEWEALKARAGGGKSKGKAKKLVEASEIPPTVTAENLAEMATAAAERLAMLKRAGLPLTGPGAEFDRVLVEAGAAGRRAPARTTAGTSGSARAGVMAARKRPAGVTDPNFEGKHPRGGKGSASGGKFVAKGANGTEVRAVQRRVGARVDGAFGDKTKAAVERFQRQHGLQIDGIVGRQTLAALRGRRDAKRVKVGALTAADRSFLTGHVRGKGRRRANATSASTKTTTTSMTPGGRTKTTTTLVEAVAPAALLDRVNGLELGEIARLPDGSAVKHHASEDGRKLWTVGRPSTYAPDGVSWHTDTPHRTAVEAVADALTRSAGSTDPAALGGPTRFGTYSRVTVNGTPARFAGVTADGRPLVRYDSARSSSGPVVVAWPEIAPAPRLLEAAG